MRARDAVVGLALAACHGGPATPDAACWPLGATSGGQVELGTGELVFEPMPVTLPIIHDSTQSDAFLRINARIRGLPPGNPDDLLDPANPKTMIVVVIPELAWTLGPHCPANLAYVPAASDASANDMLHSLNVGFGFDRDVRPADGKTAHITIDVVSHGLAAHDEKDVVLSITVM